MNESKLNGDDILFVIKIGDGLLTMLELGRPSSDRQVILAFSDRRKLQDYASDYSIKGGEAVAMRLGEIVNMAINLELDIRIDNDPSGGESMRINVGRFIRDSKK